MSATGAAALGYARKGLRVLPLHTPDEDGRCSCRKGGACTTPGKHPRTQNGVTDATTDEATVRRYWDMWPEANVAIGTGDGLVVLDVDPRSGGDGALESLQAAHGRELPVTAKVATGGGGWHLFLDAPAGTRSRDLAPGVELKGEGSYVVCPPSLHSSGREYVWIHDGERAAAPAWLLEAGQQRRNGGAPPVEEAIPEGQRNSTLLSLAGSMRRRGMGPAEIEAALEVTNGQRCRPPLDADEVRQIAEGVQRYEPEQTAAAVTPEGTSGSGLPVLRADEGDLLKLGEASLRALESAHESDPRLFRFSGAPCRIERDDAEVPVARPLTNDLMRYELSLVARWVRVNKAGAETPARVPMDGVRQVLATPDLPLSVLSRIVDVPVLAADGSLVVNAGYTQGLYLARELPGLSVPEEPTPAQIAAARGLLLELVADFPFTGDSARATALALLLLPFARELIDGPTPLHLFEKPTPGTGATLLADVITRVFTGRALSAMTAAGDEEMRKRITTKLLQAPPYIVFDNLTSTLGGDALSTAITATTWEDRLLGFNREAKAPVRCSWIATGNNPSVSEEIARRTVRCRLDAGVPDPHLRDPGEFAHPDLRGWVRRNRVQLVGAALTLGRAWLVQGRPYGGRQLGMFEQWSKVVGGMLEVAGVPGFLEELVMPAQSNQEGVVWTSFVAAWWAEHGRGRVTVADLLPLAERHDVELGPGDEKNRRMCLGRKLAKGRDTLVGRLQVKDGGMRDGYPRWTLEEIG